MSKVDNWSLYDHIISTWSQVAVTPSNSNHGITVTSAVANPHIHKISPRYSYDVACGSFCLSIIKMYLELFQYIYL